MNIQKGVSNKEENAMKAEVYIWKAIIKSFICNVRISLNKVFDNKDYLNLSLESRSLCDVGEVRCSWLFKFKVEYFHHENKVHYLDDGPEHPTCYDIACVIEIIF